MKRCLFLTLAALAVSHGTSLGQTLVDGTSYPGLFSPAANVTVDPNTSPGLLDVVLAPDAEATGPLGTYWEATATGGAELYALGIQLSSTGAQVALSDNSLKFNVSNNPSSLLGALGVGLSLSLEWSATATFDAAGNELILTPNTVYRVSFDVADGSGLLNSTLGISPTFGVELIDGAGNPVSYEGGGTLANILGLELLDIVGGPADTGRATVQFETGATVPAGAAGLRFTGSALLPASLLDIGTNFATVSGISLIEVDPYTLWVEDSGIEDESDWDRNADPDQDGRPNIQEFASDTDPTSGAHGESYVEVGDADGGGPETSCLVMTIAVREGAEFTEGTGENAGSLVASTKSVDYRVEGSFDLVNWTLAVSEVVPNNSFLADLPPLENGWEYRSFRVPGQTSDTPKAFLRAVFE